jgi:hypothetical protein
MVENIVFYCIVFYSILF